jgi:hypothetical protein
MGDSNDDETESVRTATARIVQGGSDWLRNLYGQTTSPTVLTAR